MIVFQALAVILAIGTVVIVIVFFPAAGCWTNA